MSKQITFSYGKQIYIFTVDNILDAVKTLNALHDGKSNVGFITNVEELSNWIYLNVDMYQENLLSPELRDQLINIIDRGQGDVETLVKMVLASGLMGFYNGLVVAAMKQTNAVN